MEDREALEIWRLGVLLLFYWVINCPTVNGPHIDITLMCTCKHRHTQGRYNYSNSFAKATWLSLHTRDPCTYSDITSLTVTLGLINFYYPFIRKIKRIISYNKIWRSSHRCAAERSMAVCKDLTAPQPCLTSESWEEMW